jgi:hypothetical protein
MKADGRLAGEAGPPPELHFPGLRILRPETLLKEMPGVP